MMEIRASFGAQLGLRQPRNKAPDAGCKTCRGAGVVFGDAVHGLGRLQRGAQCLHGLQQRDRTLPARHPTRSMQSCRFNVLQPGCEIRKQSKYSWCRAAAPPKPAWFLRPSAPPSQPPVEIQTCKRTSAAAAAVPASSMPRAIAGADSGGTGKRCAIAQ